MSQQRDQEEQQVNDQQKNDDNQPLQKEQPDPQDEFCNDMCKEIHDAKCGKMICRTLCSFIIFLLLGIIFLIKGETGDECQWLGLWSLIFWISCFVIAFLRFPVDFIMVIIPWKSGTLNCTMGFHVFMHRLELIVYIVYVIIATLLYLILREACETLGPLVKWFLIISYIILIIWAIVDYNEKKKWEEENLAN